jgi:sugar phosphate isomerase/epimerase
LRFGNWAGGAAEIAFFSTKPFFLAQSSAIFLRRLQSGFAASSWKRNKAMAAVRGAGFSTWISDGDNFDQLRSELDRAAELGMEFAEIPLFMIDLIAGGRVLPGQMRRLKEATAGRGIGFTAHGPIALNLMAPRELLPRHMAVAKATIEIAAEIGAAHLVLHSGQSPETGDAVIEAAYAQQRESLAQLGEFAASGSLILAVENVLPLEPGLTSALPSRVAREIEAINHPNVRGCLDVSHAAIMSRIAGVDFFAEAEALARVARHVHVHDSYGDPTRIFTFVRSEKLAFGLGDLHLPLGWGNLPWRELMSRADFEPDVIFNLELPGVYRVALEETIATMRGHIAAYAGRKAG